LGAGAWGNGNRPAVAADDIGAGGIGSDAGGIWSGIGKLEAARARQRDLAVAGAWRASAGAKPGSGGGIWRPSGCASGGGIWQASGCASGGGIWRASGCAEQVWVAAPGGGARDPG
jgi:hypothetical protein